MNVLAMTWAAWGFWWVVVSFTLAGAWCASIELARWQQQRRRRKRRLARGGWLYDRDHDRLSL
jgi:hypothetical protein